MCLRAGTIASGLKQQFSIMTSSAKNLAAWQVDAKGPLIVKESSIHEPGTGEIRIKVLASAITPADAKQATQQIMPRFKYPGILGSQCAGMVDQVGPGVSKVMVGDRVAAVLNNYANGGDPARASHQRYAIAEEYEVVKIGNTISFLDATARNGQTPGNALFKQLGLERPSVEPPEKPTPKGQTILIWGGSSAMGSLAISYAKLAGYTVITTCSSRNFDLVKDLGADHVLARDDPDLVEKIRAISYIDYWFDTISLPNTLKQIIELATAQHEKDGKEFQVCTLLPTSKAWSPDMPDFPDFFKPSMLFFKNKAPENKDHVEWLNGTPDKPGFLERGLQGGWIRGVPGRSIGGLDKVEEAIDVIIKNKHSGVRMVVEPWHGEE